MKGPRLRAGHGRWRRPSAVGAPRSRALFGYVARMNNATMAEVDSSGTKKLPTAIHFCLGAIDPERALASRDPLQLSIVPHATGCPIRVWPSRAFLKSLVAGLPCKGDRWHPLRKRYQHLAMLGNRWTVDLPPSVQPVHKLPCQTKSCFPDLGFSIRNNLHATTQTRN